MKNSSQHAAVQKRDPANLNTDCNSEIIHWSRAKATAITVFLLWVSVAKSMGELGRLECWVANQANLISNALSDLFRDEEVTRQTRLQNWVAIDYLLLLHHHTCEEFEGLCCFSLLSRAEDVCQSIKKIRDMVHDIKKKTKDWFDNLFGDWGLKGWVGSTVKTGLLVLFLLLIIGIAFGLIKRFTHRLFSDAMSTLSINHVAATSTAPEMELEEIPPEEELDSEDFLPIEKGQWPMPFEQRPTNQQWFGDLYPESEYLAPQVQFRSF